MRSLAWVTTAVVLTGSGCAAVVAPDGGAGADVAADTAPAAGHRCPNAEFKIYEPRMRTCDDTPAYCTQFFQGRPFWRRGRDLAFGCDPRRPGTCVNADVCDANGCRCGDRPACAADELCVRGDVDDPHAPPHCECIEER